jgi:hypothetical protein
MNRKVISTEKAYANSIKGVFQSFLHDIKHNGKPAEIERYLLCKPFIKDIMVKDVLSGMDEMAITEIYNFIVGK